MRFLLASLPLAAALVLPGGAPAQTALPLECDDGASVVLTYLDSDFSNELSTDLNECNESPVGDWNRVGFADSTGAADVSLVGAVTSEDGLELTLENEISLDIDSGENAAAAVFVEAEARFTAPEGDEDIPAEIVVTLARDGVLDDDEIDLAVAGEGVAFDEELEDDGDGEHRFPVSLEAGEDYIAVLTNTGRLSANGDVTQTVSMRVEVNPVPEAASALMLGVGAAVLCAARRRT
ncbi:MAG TPA: hypothetical protein VNE71_19120 [Myxococcota bacterium]|nr:hypothetical protein [Myxococcota bacterium]